MLDEALLVSAVGTCLGLLLASVVFFIFKIWIGEHVGVPFIVPAAAEIAAVYAAVILLSHSGISVIVATHDARGIKYGDRLYTMYKGKLLPNGDSITVDYRLRFR